MNSKEKESGCKQTVNVSMIVHMKKHEWRIMVNYDLMAKILIINLALSCDSTHKIHIGFYFFLSTGRRVERSNSS